MRGCRFLVLFAWIACGFPCGDSRADDFDAALLKQFHNDNKTAADQLKKEAGILLNQDPSLLRHPEKDLDAARKLLGQLYDDTHLPREERSALIRKLQDRVRTNKELGQKNHPETISAPEGKSFGEPSAKASRRESFDPGLSSASQPKIQVKQWIRVNTSAAPALVPAGGTGFLSGYSFSADTRNEYGVPILGKIPYLGRGFRNVGYSSVGGSIQFYSSVRVISMEDEEARFQGKK